MAHGYANRATYFNEQLLNIEQQYTTGLQNILHRDRLAQKGAGAQGAANAAGVAGAAGQQATAQGVVPQRSAKDRIGAQNTELQKLRGQAAGAGAGNGAGNGAGGAAAAQGLKRLEAVAYAQNNDKIARCRRKQRDLNHRLADVMRRVHCLQARGWPLEHTEAQLFRRLEALAVQLNDPRSAGAELRELVSWIDLGGGPGGGGAGGGGAGAGGGQEPMVDALCDADGADVFGGQEMAVYQFLETQREGLRHLSEILQKDQRDLDTIREGLSSAAGW